MKGLLILSNLVEDIEAVGTRDLLQRAGIDIVTATFEDSLSIKTSFGLKIEVDTFGHDVLIDEFDFLIIPGGPYVKKTVDDDVSIKQLAKDFHSKGKLIAAICAGPRFLGQVGLLDGKRFTAFTGSEQDAKNGFYLEGMKSVVDGNIITASGAGALYEFAYEITKYLISEEKAIEVRKNILY